MKLNPPNAHRSQIKISEKRQTRNVQFQVMANAFRILKPIQKSSKCVWVFRKTGANAFAKNQTHLAYEDKSDLYCNLLYIMTVYDNENEHLQYIISVNNYQYKLNSPVFDIILLWELRHINVVSYD